MTNKLTREEVYKLIDGERDYQENLGIERSESVAQRRVLEVAEYITMLECYTRKASDAWCGNSGSEKALDEIRKVAAIAVRCMENHGAPPRSKPKQSDDTPPRVPPVVTMHKIQEVTKDSVEALQECLDRMRRTLEDIAFVDKTVNALTLHDRYYISLNMQDIGNMKSLLDAMSRVKKSARERENG